MRTHVVKEISRNEGADAASAPSSREISFIVCDHSSREVLPLRDGLHDHGLHFMPPFHDLLVTESQGVIAAEGQLRIMGDVARPLGSGMGRPVDLDDQSLSDEQIDLAIHDPGLRQKPHLHPSQPCDEDRLEPESANGRASSTIWRAAGGRSKARRYALSTRRLFIADSQMIRAVSWG